MPCGLLYVIWHDMYIVRQVPSMLIIHSMYIFSTHKHAHTLTHTHPHKHTSTHTQPHLFFLYSLSKKLESVHVPSAMIAIHRDRLHLVSNTQWPEIQPLVLRVNITRPRGNIIALVEINYWVQNNWDQLRPTTCTLLLSNNILESNKLPWMLLALLLPTWL